MCWTKWMSQTQFFHVMKFNRRLHDNCIEYLMFWIQIFMVVYLCNEIHKTFLQLELVAYCFWTIKAIDVSYNKLCGPCFH
jgi:hypothetical protein